MFLDIISMSWSRSKRYHVISVKMLVSHGAIYRAMAAATTAMRPAAETPSWRWSAALEVDSVLEAELVPELEPESDLEPDLEEESEEELDDPELVA